MPSLLRSSSCVRAYAAAGRLLGLALVLVPLPAASQALLHTLVSPSPESDGNFGAAVSSVPDVDGDGIADLFAGAPGEGVGGRAYVYSGATGALLHTLDPPTPAPLDAFGDAVAGLDDVDGDGHGDLLVGAYTESAGANAVGRVYLFSGSTSALDAVALNSPVPRGDRLRVRVTLTNLTTDPLTGDLFLDVDGPGVSVSRTLVSGVTLPPGVTATPTFALRVPAGAPLGSYDATVTALEGGTTSIGEATFAFEVVTQSTGYAGTGGAFGPVEVLDHGGLGSGAVGAALAEGTAPSVWPNPASGRVAFAFSLDAPSAVRLALYDVLGREVSSVDAGHLAAGPHRLALDLSALPAGVYLWQLVADGQRETGRLTLVE